jgi:hypothetical protein
MRRDGLTGNARFTDPVEALVHRRNKHCGRGRPRQRSRTGLEQE